MAESTPRLSGVLAQGLSEKWGGNGALPVWQTLEVTMAFLSSAQDQGSVRQASEIRGSRSSLEKPAELTLGKGLCCPWLVVTSLRTQCVVL